MRLVELLPELVREHAKAIAAMVVPAVSLWGTLRVNGDVTWIEWASIVGIALSAGGFVNLIPNRLTIEQVNRFYDQQEDQYRISQESFREGLRAALGDAQDLSDDPEDDEPPDGRAKHRRE